MDPPYLFQSPFRMPLTPDPSAPGSPYDCHSLGWWKTSIFEEYPDALEVPQMHEVEPKPYINEFLYPFTSMQTPISPNLSCCMSKEAQIKELQQRDRRQCSPESPWSSDGQGLTMEEVRRQQRERRRAQNRVAQRTYRLRKEEKIKELSAKLSEMERAMERMEQSNHDLSTQISTLLQKNTTLEKENGKLKEISPLDNSHGSAPIRTTFWVSRQTIPNSMITPAGRMGLFEPGSIDITV